MAEMLQKRQRVDIATYIGSGKVEELKELVTSLGITFDFTGYGESRGPATYYHEDLLAAARFAEHWAGGFPVHVVGVSMGAFAAANASPPGARRRL